ncbi:MAG: tetratricopeptide repeat protein [Myxococcota bacterium]|nr:tetratricopeptide repeat protein [Myxococcota bacterium]
MNLSSIIAKRTLIVGALMASIVMVSPTAQAITKDEIITLTKLGFSPKEIIKSIEKDRTIFELSVPDILALKKAKVHEEVLKFMLGSKDRFGDGTPAGTAGPADDGTADTVTEEIEPEIEETPEERAAREEQMRQEALKLLEEKREAEERQARAFAQGVLAKGRALADSGRFVESIQAFQRFMDQGGFADDSEEAYLANFGIANALVKAGMVQAAARKLMEVVLAGPERPFFKTAFKQLRELRQKVDDDNPRMAELTDFYVGEFSRGFQDNFQYVLGEFFSDFGNWTRAATYLDQVSPTAPDFAKANYLKGLNAAKQSKYRDAIGSFERAIEATEKNGSDPAVADLAYMALARIFYELDNYDAAIYYYRKVPADSYKGATALYESAWVYFMNMDYMRALGTFHTLHSPYFDHQFYPELWLLEAKIYQNICRYQEAESAVTRYKAEVQPIALPLKQFLDRTRRPDDFYQAVVGTVSGSDIYGLPEAVLPAILGNVEFYNLYRTIKQINSELEKIEPAVESLGEFGTDLKRKLQTLKRERITETGIKIQKILRGIQNTLTLYADKLTELEVDLADEKMAVLDEKLMELEGIDEEEQPDSVEVGGAIAIVGSGSWSWPFQGHVTGVVTEEELSFGALGDDFMDEEEDAAKAKASPGATKVPTGYGEYWSDEIGSYRAFIKSKCQQLPPQ